MIAATGGLTAQVDWLGLRVGGHLALSLHSSYEPGELSQWQHHKYRRSYYYYYHYCHDADLCVCLSGTDVHCDHTVHFSIDLSLQLDSPRWKRSTEYSAY